MKKAGELVTRLSRMGISMTILDALAWVRNPNPQ
jgi:hypothetical protein